MCLKLANVFTQLRKSSEVLQPKFQSYTNLVQEFKERIEMRKHKRDKRQPIFFYRGLRDSAIYPTHWSTLARVQLLLESMQRSKKSTRGCPSLRISGRSSKLASKLSRNHRILIVISLKSSLEPNKVKQLGDLTKLSNQE